MQDRLPGVRLGECAAALGFAPILAIEKLFEQFVQLHTVEVEAKPIALVTRKPAGATATAPVVRKPA